MRILDKDFILLALINYKSEIFNERYISSTEVNKYTECVQNEFNKRNLEVVIKLGNINKDCFFEFNNLITKKDECYININILPTDILNVLNDKELLSNFYLELENEKIKKLINKNN